MAPWLKGSSAVVSSSISLVREMWRIEAGQGELRFRVVRRMV
jgi:hypothetical protein